MSIQREQDYSVRWTTKPCLPDKLFASASSGPHFYVRWRFRANTHSNSNAGTDSIAQSSYLEGSWKSTARRCDLLNL